MAAPRKHIWCRDKATCDKVGSATNKGFREGVMKRILGLSVAAVALIAAGYAAGQQQAAPPQIHRVVTGIDKSGKAVALFDSNVPLLSMRSPNPAGDMWVTE